MNRVSIIHLKLNIWSNILKRFTINTFAVFSDWSYIYLFFDPFDVIRLITSICILILSLGYHDWFKIFQQNIRFLLSVINLLQHNIVLHAFRSSTQQSIQRCEWFLILEILLWERSAQNLIINVSLCQLLQSSTPKST